MKRLPPTRINGGAKDGRICPSHAARLHAEDRMIGNEKRFRPD
jgi:hypothetical protein